MRGERMKGGGGKGDREKGKDSPIYPYHTPTESSRSDESRPAKFDANVLDSRALEKQIKAAKVLQTWWRDSKKMCPTCGDVHTERRRD